MRREVDAVDGERPELAETAHRVAGRRRHRWHPTRGAEQVFGVVEHGLFLNMVDKVIVGDPNGPRVMTNANK